jgi:hypothetical protein
VRFCDELPFAFSWIVDERRARTSHALGADGRSWLVDPLDWTPAIRRAERLGTPVAVIQLLDRHNRDCAVIAARLGIPHLAVPDDVPESPFTAIPLVRRRPWRESALWWPATRTLVVADAIGTSRFFATGPQRAAVHPLLRLRPPRELASYDPEHLLVGHGEGLHGDDATAALLEALATARAGLPRWLLSVPFRLRR